MKVSIVIVNWNTCELLDQCLRSVYTCPPDIDFEIWVIDNGSTDESLKMLGTNYPRVRVSAIPENTGFAHANNLGMKLAQGKSFLLLNSDTIVLPGALNGLMKTLHENPSAGIVGCKLLNADRSIQESWAAFPSLISEILGRNFRSRLPVSGHAGLYQVDWVGGACMLVRSEAARQVGLLDESYFMYSEEVDWCYRMRVGGWKTLYLESAEIIHLGGGSASRTSLNQLKRLYGSKLHFFQKNYGRWQAFCLRSGLILVHLLRLVWRWFVVLINRREADAQRGRIQTQWDLIRWLWAGSLSS